MSALTSAAISSFQDDFDFIKACQNGFDPELETYEQLFQFEEDFSAKATTFADALINQQQEVANVTNELLNEFKALDPLAPAKILEQNSLKQIEELKKTAAKSQDILKTAQNELDEKNQLRNKLLLDLQKMKIAVANTPKPAPLKDALYSVGNRISQNFLDGKFS
ncbi:MAG: hypothetical protein JHC93_05825 [Parachlamydiales bacterium]|nr:hypothetical protein [Parachlamydiales bacterium]